MRLVRYMAPIAAALLLLGACARQGYPSGGPRDTAPPAMQRTEPENGTVDYSATRFFIEFDEYVTLKDPDHNVIVSPPLAHRAEYSTKGHGVQVRLYDTLLPNTTYIFSFQEAIADYNEGNLLPRIDYVFSTGPAIDSMQIKGRVVDAVTCEPVKSAITVAAYAVADDSAVVSGNPDYVTRCNAAGFFTLPYLRLAAYRLVAFDDANSNLRYDPAEAVAWTDTLVACKPMPTKAPKDTVTAAGDSTAAAPHTDSTASVSQTDSTASASHTDSIASAPHTDSLVLCLSLADRSAQRVVSSVFRAKGSVEIVVLRPLSKDYTLSWLDAGAAPDVPATQLVRSLNPSRDTLRLWTAYDAACDSLTIVIADTGGFADTLTMQYRPKKGALKSFATQFLSSAVASRHPYYDTLWLRFSSPAYAMPGVAEGDSLITVFSFADSVVSHVPWHWDPNSPTHLRAFVDFEGVPGNRYRFKVPARMFCDLWGSDSSHCSDSLVFVAAYSKPEEYGSIKVTVADGDWNMRTDGYPLVVQLLNEKGDVLRQHRLSGDLAVDADTSYAHAVLFQHLPPAKYRIRAIADTDRNSAWTTGDYWLHRQPEKVVYFPKTLELQANWQMEEKWHVFDEQGTQQ
ncbi:MAG: Ig-like domain-containing protein [Bacteroidales bacterium]|nr:Ig-like domain-containing protein [Bacteroidales bacterium]